MLDQLPACTDLINKPWVLEAGADVIDAPFIAHGNIATAGGCLASQYLATWMIARGASLTGARDAMHHVAPVGEEECSSSEPSLWSPFITQEIGAAA
ncbi:hypothetical protein [Novosphingobium rhizovicinum]|uniref:hypothetical protein n=1 Tax=Novosphingobium rhizovicinum TaxID=3228928 RepID=UPI003B01021A